MNNQTIKSIEKIIKTSFPKELISFFKTNSNLQKNAVNDEEGEPAYITEWHSPETALDKLDDYIDEKYLPKRYIPIADGGGGNIFIYSTDHKTKGNIYYIDLEYMDTDKEKYFKTLISNSFQEFLSKLYEIKEEEDWISVLLKKLDDEDEK